MQRSIVQSLYGYTKVGLIRRTPLTSSVCEYKTLTTLRTKPTAATTTNKTKPISQTDASRLEAVKQLLREHMPRTNTTTTITIKSNKKIKSPSSASTLSTPASTTAPAAVNKSGRSRRDEEINSRWITFIDEKGQIHEENKRLDRVLQEFDRSLYFLVEVNPTARPPVCRLFEKKQLFDKDKASKKKKNTVSSDQVTKEIVFGWNVSPHDMGHKLGKAMQFLDKGNKVKVDIVYKRGQKRVDKETQQQVIDQVKQHLNIYKIAKPPTLSGSNCMMVFENKK